MDWIEDSVAEESLISLLEGAGFYLVTAESLTGGKLSQKITAEPGASKVFLGGVVAYQDKVKQELLGVSASLISQQGAVDAEVAAQMAVGARERFAKINQIALEKIISVSTTGVAGPGSVESKPAGLVYIGISSVAGDAVYSHNFDGDRDSIRAQSVEQALVAIREQFSAISGY